MKNDLKRRIKDILRFFRVFAVLPSCIACGDRISGHDVPLCQSCRKRYLTERAKSCTMCGFPAFECKCGIKPDGELQIPVLHCVPYDPRRVGVVTKLVFSAKDEYLRDVFEFIAQECFKVLEYRGILNGDELTVTWIPRSRRTVRRIGHDQSKEIATRIAGMIDGAKCVSTLTNRSGSQQKTLSRSARMRNARSAYELKTGAVKSVSGRRVLLVDDIITTGASMTVATKLLIDAGANEVIPLTYAKSDRQFRKYKLAQTSSNTGVGYNK